MTCITCGGSLGKRPHKKKCRECYNAYMREYMLKRYYERRSRAVEKLGGKCVDCGSSDQLEFDHADASTKKFDVARIWNYSTGRFEEELEKCVLRCESCHLSKTLRQDRVIVPHGGGVAGKKNCSCFECRAKKAEYMKRYNKTKN